MNGGPSHGFAKQANDHTCWVLMDPSSLPSRWRERAVPMLVVPLLPEEAQELLDGERVLPEVMASDELLLRLIARGTSTRTISLKLGLSVRTVHRRLAQLRERYGVRSTAQLVALLSRQGFR